MNEWQHLYNSTRWKTARKDFLFHNPRCVMCLSMNRQTPANEVDHIIPHRGDDGLFWDANNYQALCKPCHSEKTYYETIRTQYLPRSVRPKSKDITFLVGPPCSGKTTWARNQGKKVIDLDDIKKDVSGCDPYEMDEKYLATCLAVRNTMITKVKEPLIIISTAYNKGILRDWSKRLKTKVSLMTTTQRQCLQWLKESGRSRQRLIESLIKRWFKEYQPSGREVYIR